MSLAWMPLWVFFRIQATICSRQLSNRVFRCIGNKCLQRAGLPFKAKDLRAHCLHVSLTDTPVADLDQLLTAACNGISSANTSMLLMKSPVPSGAAVENPN